MKFWILIWMVLAPGFGAFGQESEGNETKELTAREYFRLGNDSWESKNYREATQYYTRAIDIDPEYASAYNRRGISYRTLGQYNNAIHDYTKAIDIDPEYAIAYINRGISYRLQSDLINAEKDFLTSIKLLPSNDLIYYELGLTYFYMGKPYKAVEAYLEGILIGKNIFEGLDRLSFDKIKSELPALFGTQ